MNKKTVAIVGKGAREHALCWKLCHCSDVLTIYVIPGNGGTATIPNVQNVNVKWDVQEIVAWCSDKKIDLVIVGPEQFLADGIFNLLKANNIKCFGPSKEAALIEASKSWSKLFMKDFGIPTARAEIFNDYDKAIDHIDKFPQNESFVIKASGLAQGKGVVICNDKLEAKTCVKEMMVLGSLGSAGKVIVIEEVLEGDEVSVLAFCDGETFSLMPPTQDHKRLKDNDYGPNTGGMGAVCPYYLSECDINFIKTEIFEKTLNGMKIKGHSFKGVLYAGLILTKQGIKVLEFNCRFGDPEAQVLLPLLETDLFRIFEACCDGNLKPCSIKWSNKSAVAIVMASDGYPVRGSVETIIPGLPLANITPNIEVFHAATKFEGSSYFATSGRILTVVAINHSMSVASLMAKKTCLNLLFKGCQYRGDIGNRAIIRNILKLGVRTYKSAGVNISSGNELVLNLKSLVSVTHNNCVITPLGSFAAAFDLEVKKYKSPLLVTGCDGVGTKLKIAEECNNYLTIGEDLVAMSVNDILALGAEPLFFLDYIACGELNVTQTLQLVKGITEGCSKAKCALIGGETAEMPGILQKNEYELAGFVVGAVERDKILPNQSINVGDKMIYLPSSGIHSNGYSLIRKLMADLGLCYNEKAPFTQQNLTYGEEFLKPTTIYSNSVLHLHEKSMIKAFAHITGGGLSENIIRVLPHNLSVALDAAQWKIPPIFGWIAAVGEVPEREMLRTFNCGIGGIVIVSPQEVKEVTEYLQSSVIGEVGAYQAGQSQFKIINFDVQLGKVMLPFVRLMIKSEIPLPKRVAVLISGTGSNMQSLIEKTRNFQSVAQVVLVISDKINAGGISIAEKLNIRAEVIQKQSGETREEHEQRIHSLLMAEKIDIICLAGYMRILTESFVKRWRGRLLNVHPSLLPSFPGLHSQKQALESGVKFTGCTVHFVETKIDSGAIIEQGIVSVNPEDKEYELIERIKAVEHKIYPKALKLVASGKIELDLNSGRILYK